MVWYQHGGDIYSQNIKMDYSANINPLGLPKGVKQAVINALDSCAVYPDSRCTRLVQGISKYHGISAENLICGNGAADLIFQLVWALSPKKALLTAPSFLEYEQALKTVGCRIQYHILEEADGFRLNAKKWMEEIDESFDIVFICNPNNPTGLAVRKEDMELMLGRCRELGITAIVDECFMEFLEEPEVYSVLDKICRYENLFILKAFTKLYAMAGIRLGYGISSNLKLLDQMHLVRQPWSISSIAQAAGEAALLETEYVEQTRQLIPVERRYLSAKLRKLGFTVYESMANYVFFKDENRGRGKGLYETCRQNQVLIRSCDNYIGLEAGFYRICVKTREENRDFLKLLEGVL